MIEIKSVTKSFDDLCAVNDVTINIQEGMIFGLIGTNGAGKSTLLRMMSGVYKPDKGTITVDGQPVYDNVNVKKEIFYLSDEQYFFNEATPETMGNYYSSIYEKFDLEGYYTLLDKFQLGRKRKIKTLSKGMKRQVSFLLGVSANTKYLFCDETFDGLDPVMRQGIKSIFAKEVAERNFTPVIASHNLRELEDICDSIGLLHKGGVLLSRDITDMKVDIHKVQFIMEYGEGLENVLSGLDILTSQRQGKLVTATIRGSEEAIHSKMQAIQPVFYEILPLSLEEIFISETEAVGYDLHNII